MKLFMNPELVDVFLALIIDFSIGDPKRLYHPVMAIGSFIHWFEKTVNKEEYSRRLRWFFGLLLWILTVTTTYLLCWSLLKLAYGVHPVIYHALNITTIWMGIAAKSLKRASFKVMEELEKKNIQGARINLSYIVGRDTQELSFGSIIRASVETVAENASDGVIAPLCYALIGGAPLLWAYKAVNTLDSMVGYRNERYKDFGNVSARMDDLFNLIPARITAIFMILSSGCLGLTMKDSFKVWIKDHGHHKSPNSGHPEAAAAGALGIRLGGDASYFGEVFHKPTIGVEKRAPDTDDIKRVNKMMYSATILFLILSSLLIVMIREGGER